MLKFSLIKGWTVRKSKIKQITLAVCLAFMPISVFAAGLGKLNVNSGLGEPLNAEIELLSLSPDELATLTAAIASEDAYAAQGINRAYIHSNIRVELGKSLSGAPVLKVRSTVPVDDPFLDMLVQVDWATGRLQREYTVLLDPPGYKPVLEPTAPLQITAPTIKPSSASPASNISDSGSNSSARPAPTESKVTSQPAKSTPKVTNKVATPEAATDSGMQTEVTTVRGDTLSSIASRMQADGVSLDQMLMALYDNNKNAFIGNNINQLKVGQIIRMPSNEQLAARSSAEASREVKVHASNWNNYRNSLAGIVATTPIVDSAPEEKQKATGKIATAEDKAASVTSAPKDVVKLSSGEKDKSNTAKNTNKVFEEKITALQEETTAREKALLEAQERSNVLEKQIQDMQKLLALKSQTMANVQKNAENVTSTNDVDNKVKDTQSNTDNAITEAQVTPSVEKPVSDESISSEPNQAGVPQDLNPASSADIADAQKNAEQSAPKPAVVTPAQPVAVEPEVSFIDSLLESTNPLYIALGALLALLAGGWLYLRNKRKRDLDSFERGILTSGGLRANTVFGNTTGATGNSDTSFLTDFAQSADGSMIDTNDVDPIAEAEVYMAYGRDAQAEEILKDAISKEPTRYELHLKLLEMYAARQDGSAFEAIAGELYTTLGADDPTWAKVAAIGVVMEPNNPLYAASAGSSESMATQKLDASDFSGLAATDDLDLDFSTDISETETPKEALEQNAIEASFAGASATDQTETFEFDATQQFKPGSLGDTIDDATNAIAPDVAKELSAPELDTKADSNSMDFDLSDFSFDAPTLNDANTDVAGTEGADLQATPTLDAENTMTFTTSVDDFPRFDLPEESSVADALPDAVEPPALTVEANDIDFSFDLPNDSMASDPLISNDLQIDEPTEADATNFDIEDLSLDLNAQNMLVEDAKDASQNQDYNDAPVEFDLSSISFDLDDTPNQLVNNDETATASSDMAMPESEDVAIKLDLVSAYIEMDDKEGARELLEEVLKEGGLEQQKRAQALMATLN